MISDLVSKKFGIEESIGFGIDKIGIDKSIGFGIGNLSLGKKFRIHIFGIVKHCLKLVKIHKYAWDTNRNTHRKTRSTQIQKYRHTQIEISLLGVPARSEREKNEIFLKKSSHEKF